MPRQQSLEIAARYVPMAAVAGDFYIDTGQPTALYAGAGHPPLLIWRPAEQKIFEFRTRGVVLGQFDEAQYEAMTLNYDRGDRFFLYTDGIVEASNMSDELFGWERFKACIMSNSKLPSDKLVDKLIEDLNNWSAKGSSTTLDDDLTLVVVDVACSAK
jgi:serine phosphatase RsbU (regulator of sigma subunit)